MRKSIFVTLIIILLSFTITSCAGIQEKFANYTKNAQNKSAPASLAQSQESYKGAGVIECRAKGEKEIYKILANKDDEVLSLQVIDGRNNVLYNGKAQRDPKTGYFVNKEDKAGAQYAISKDNKLVLQGFFQLADCPYKQSGVFLVKPQAVYTNLD